MLAYSLKLARPTDDRHYETTIWPSSRDSDLSNGTRFEISLAQAHIPVFAIEISIVEIYCLQKLTLQPMAYSSRSLCLLYRTRLLLKSTALEGLRSIDSD